VVSLSAFRRDPEVAEHPVKMDVLPRGRVNDQKVLQTV
jgi:hypothetical protein